MFCRMLSWSATASGMPSGRARQKVLPYARIVSATSWPTVRVSGGSGGGSSRTGELREERGQRDAKRLERIAHAPAITVLLGDRIGDRAELERRYAGERSRAQHTESLHRLDLTGNAPADATRSADRQHVRVGERLACACEQLRIGMLALDARDASARVEHVAVDGFRSEHDRGVRERLC